VKKVRAFKRAGKRHRIDIDLQELDGILDSAIENPISEKEADKVKTAIHTMAELLTPRPRTTEKTADILESTDSAPTDPTEESKPPRPGHGRNGAEAFTGAHKVEVTHGELKAGCACPECSKGKVYPQKEPKVLVRFVGQPPVQATVYEMERLRCNLCGQIFSAQEPEGVGPEKYDETVPSIVAQLKYGSGMPFKRIEVLQKKMGVPLPAATQWELVEEAAEVIKPVHNALIQLAAQGEVLHNDDTSMRILDLDRPADDKRTGIFTTGVVSYGDEQKKIALFLTGVQHAGENLRDLLQHRAKEAAAPMLMCDALSRNVPKFEVPDAIGIMLANCLTHGRRYFVDVSENFPDECRYVLETLRDVYVYDREARELRLKPKERLAFHQEHSKPLMDNLQAWMIAQLDEKRTEPNSGLGQAMRYVLKHWEPLTLFLREIGAPLDNNICERALKKAVLHRKNALFYRTLKGAQVGDLYMSLIHTCELNSANPFDYLTELQRHAKELRMDPMAWMPWNYKATIEQVKGPPG
jgi:rubredoxin